MEFKGISDAIKKIEALEDRVADTALTVMAVEGQRSIEMNFDAEGRPEKWEPSKKKTKRPGSKTLTESGNMRKVSVNINSEGKKVEYGANPLARAYTRTHAEGLTIDHPGKMTKSGKRGKPYKIKMPKRNPFVIPQEDESRIVKNVSTAIKKVL